MLHARRLLWSSDTTLPMLPMSVESVETWLWQRLGLFPALALFPEITFLGDLHKQQSSFFIYFYPNYGHCVDLHKYFSLKHNWDARVLNACGD
jgi:hypothetical protein